MCSSPSAFGLDISSDSNGPMKMYLNSQYHMDPPAQGHHSLAAKLCANFTDHVDGTTAQGLAHSSTVMGMCW